MAVPRLSVVVPTCNRSASLRRLLEALARDPEANTCEVIVVDDGSTDDTASMAASVATPYELRVLSRAATGPAAARNAGAARARGDLLLFLDDDVEPEGRVLAAHARAVQGETEVLGLGDLPPSIPGSSLFDVTLRGWWSGMREGIRRPWYRHGFRDVLTGHLSIPRATFERLGGFDATLRCHEDWEFGYRAMRAGVDLRFLPDAVAWHHDSSTLSKVLRRKFDEGVADVQLVTKHPELAAALPLTWPSHGRKQRALRHLACRGTPGAHRLVHALTAMLPLYETFGLRFRWRALLEGLLTYWYWRGVISAAGRDSVRELSRPGPPRFATVPRIDLAEGLARASLELDRLRPDTVTFLFQGETLMTIPEIVGMERLRGAHLPGLIANWFPLQYQRALGLSGAVPPVLASFVGEDNAVAAPTSAVA